MKRGDGGTGIGNAGGMIGDAAFMPAIKDVQRRRDMENDGKGKAEMIGPLKYQLQPHEADNPMIAAPRCQAVC